MKREGEEGGEELKLPGKERNRVGLNLLDCFQLHASTLLLSYSLSLSLFLLLLCCLDSTLCLGFSPPDTPPYFSLLLPDSPIAVKRRLMVRHRWGGVVRVNSSRFYPSSSLG